MIGDHSGHRSAVEKHKDFLRNRFRTIRAAFTHEEYEIASLKICERLRAHGEWRPTETVHIFWPLLSRKEPDILPFIKFLVKQQVRILLPVVTSFSTKPGNHTRMRQAELKSFDAVHQNKWGITEPDYNSFVSPGEVDIAIVPALGADREGYRIGYGMGFYDEFLSGISAPVMCPIFSACLSENIPHEPHDIRVATIITDRETIETGVT